MLLVAAVWCILSAVGHYVGIYQREDKLEKTPNHVCFAAASLWLPLGTTCPSGYTAVCSTLTAQLRPGAQLTIRRCCTTDFCPLSLGGQQAQAHLSWQPFGLLWLPTCLPNDADWGASCLGCLLHPSAGSSPGVSLPPRLPIQPSSICSPLAPQLSTPPRTRPLCWQQVQARSKRCARRGGRLVCLSRFPRGEVSALALSSLYFPPAPLLRCPPALTHLFPLLLPEQSLSFLSLPSSPFLPDYISQTEILQSFRRARPFLFNSHKYLCCEKPQLRGHRLGRKVCHGLLAWPEWKMIPCR